MKNTLKLIAAVAIAAVAFTQTSNAALITGNIAFSGGAQTDSASANSSTMVAAWNAVKVTSDSGAFSTIAIGSLVTMAAPWTFNSGPLAAFWNVGGFTFNLTSSAVSVNNLGYVGINIVGTVSGNGYTPTAMSGSFTMQDPAGNPSTKEFSGSLSFNSVPDGGTTALLLGSALSGLALIRRKLTA